MEGYGTAWRLVEQTRRRIQRLRAQADSLWWSLLPPLLVWAFVVGEHFGDHEFTTRLGLKRALLLTLAAWGLGLALILLRRLFLKRHSPDVRETALLLGHGDIEIRDRLLNGLEVIEAGRANKQGFDPGLVAASLDLVLPRLQRVDMKRVLPLQSRRRAFSWFASAWILALLLFLLGGADARLAAGRLLEPEREFRGEALFQLRLTAVWPDSLHPGRLLEGQQLELRVEALGQALPSDIELVAAPLAEGTASGEAGSWTLPLRLGRATLAGLTPRGSLRFQASGLEEQLGQSRRIHSNPMDIVWLRPPHVNSLLVRFLPPRYTGLPSRDLPVGSADFTCPVGSQVEIRASLADELEAAWLDFASPEGVVTGRLALDASHPQRMSARFLARETGRWQLQVRDIHALQNPQPLVHAMTVTPDQPPRLRVLAPLEQEGRLSRDLSLDLALLAEDDYGFSSCKLAWKIYSRTMLQLMPPPDPSTLDSLPRDWSRRSLELIALQETDTPGKRAATEERWDLSTLSLLPDDELIFFFELRDNDGWNGPKTVRSGLFRYKVPGLEELFAETRQDEQELAEEAEELVERAQENRERLAELQKEMRRDAEMTWEREQRLKQVVREQEQIAKQAGELGQKLESLQQKMDANQLISEELRHKLEQLKGLLNEVMSPELLEKLRKAAEQAMSQPPPAPNAPRPQANMEEILRQMEEQLDRFLSVLEQLRLEQRLEELAKRAEDLLERQRQLQEDLKQGTDLRTRSSEEAARKQDAESLRSEMEKLKDEFGERSSFPHEQVDSAQKQMDGKKIPPRLGEMEQQLSQGESPSSESQVQMDQDLNELAESLQQALEKSREQSMAEVSREIERICQELLVISLRQEEIGIQLKGLGGRSARVPQLAEETVENQLGVRAAASSIYELSRRSLHIPTSALAELGVADQNLDLMLNGFHERQLGRSSTTSPEAMGRVNRSILLLKEAERNMQQSKSSSGFQQMMEKMAEAAARQQCLNGQCNNLMSVKPGNSQKPMSISFGEAKSEQGSIREGLEGLQEKLGEEGKPRLGDLGQMAGDMKEVEKDLEQLTYTERTQKLQERIVSRLLDAQRSVRRQDEEKKRESRSAQALHASPPAAVELQRERALERDLQRALKTGYRQDMQDLIRDYFRALEEAPLLEDVQK